jgi:nucleoside-diphosphate-sugar epimerase
MKRSVLITGASGFIGGCLFDEFRSLGWETWGIGRRQLERRGYLSHDLANPLPELPDGPVDVVVHAAARSSPWGTRREFERDNILATRNVIEFCQRHGRPRLIYISSSSVYYRPEHQFDITEETALPKRAVNRYAATKRDAEQLVRGYSGRWVVLRPRAVFGPHDTVLLPRILEAARKEALPLLVNRNSSVRGDLIYIENLVDYIVKAATIADVHGDFNLTNDEPVAILEFLLEAFRLLGIPKPRRKLSAAKAMFAAGCLEAFHALFLPRREPAITRFGVHVFRYSKTFDVSKAKEVLGEPRISMDESLQRTVNWFREHGTEAP